VTPLETIVAPKRDKPGIIYLAKNLVNGKCYVGQTGNTLNGRIKGHQKCAKSGSRLLFHLALNKHGVDGFEVSVLQECCGRDCLNAAERWWIGHLNCMSPKGYNLTDGGEGSSPSEETRKLISEAAKKRSTPERMKAMSELAAKVILTPEQMERKVRALEEYRANYAHPALGTKWSPERHANRKSQVLSEDSRRKMAESHRGGRRSEETKKKMSESRRRVIAGGFTFKHTEEQKEKYRNQKLTEEQRDNYLAAMVRRRKTTGKREQTRLIFEDARPAICHEQLNP
jgi:group I intron endonuclease